MPSPARLLFPLRRHGRRTLMAVLVALVGCVAYYAVSTHGYRSAAGIYLADGGRSYLVIRAERFGRLTASGSDWFASLGLTGLEFSHRASYANGCILTRQEAWWPDGPPGRMIFAARLRPSSSTTGDWDLFYARIWGEDPVSLSNPLEREFWKRAYAHLTHPDPAAARRGVHREPESLPLPQFLHRVDDERLVMYFAARGARPDPKAALALIRDIAADRLDDPYLAPHRIEMEARHGDLAVAESLRERWQPLFAIHADPELREASALALAAVEQARFVRDYPKVPLFLDMFGTTPATQKTVVSPHDLEHYAIWLRSLATTDRIQVCPVPLVGGDLFASGLPVGVEAGNAMVIARSVSANALLGCLAGRQDEAYETLLGIYRLGQSLCASRSPMAGLVGLSAQARTLGALRTVVLNAGLKPAELVMLRDCIHVACHQDASLASDLPAQSFVDSLFYSLDYAGYPDSIERRRKEFRSRLASNAARLAVLEAAAGARIYHLEHGRYPTSAEELAEALPEGLPSDPYSPDQPVRLSAGVDGVVLYSVGPDLTDDAGRREYDPDIQASTAKGDIVLKVPNEREFPFPDGPVHAASAAELLAIFPNGLPADPCFHIDAAPLAIVDATTTRPLIVFSCGPDEVPDCNLLRPSGVGGRWQPVFRYATPEELAARPGAASGAAGTGSPRKTLSVVAAPADAPTSTTSAAPPAPSPLPPYDPEPRYDPTNGARSRGNLFIELPR